MAGFFGQYRHEMKYLRFLRPGESFWYQPEDSRYIRLLLGDRHGRFQKLHHVNFGENPCIFSLSEIPEIDNEILDFIVDEFEIMNLKHHEAAQS